jgi:hypothetical protein
MGGGEAGRMADPQGRQRLGSRMPEVRGVMNKPLIIAILIVALTWTLLFQCIFAPRCDTKTTGTEIGGMLIEGCRAKEGPG